MNRLFVSICSVLVSLVSLTGCSTPHYALRPAPSVTSHIERIERMDFIKVSGHSADVMASMDVFNILDKRYLLAFINVSNISNAKIEISYDSLDIACRPSSAGKKLAPFEPETLITRLAKERASQESSRNWGTVFLALSAAHHDSGSSTDITKVDRTVENRNADTQSQSSQASKALRFLDESLLRRDKVETATETGGCVLFPFVKADFYKLHVRIGGETFEFDFQLRSY